MGKIHRPLAKVKERLHKKSARICIRHKYANRARIAAKKTKQKIGKPVDKSLHRPDIVHTDFTRHTHLWQGQKVVEQEGKISTAHVSSDRQPWSRWRGGGTSVAVGEGG